MSDKLNFLPASMKTLRSYSLLVLEGPDAVAFIQAQSMNDVKALVDGQWHWNGLLNPKGRLIALFALVRLREDLIYLLSPDFPVDKLATHLQRFVFRSKVKLTMDSGKVFAAEFGSLSTTDRNSVYGNLTDGICLDFSSDSSFRKLWLLPESEAVNVVSDNQCEDQWRDLDIQHGLPRLLDSQTEQWTPQMLSLDRLNAFSLKKGCYPGQEIVARTHYLGQAKRHARLIQCEDLELGAAIYREGEKVGEVICVNSKKDMGLALLQSISEADQLVCKDCPAKPLQALTGLQRSN